MKRDLEADLGWLSSPICGHILKRAIEAEALARELVEALEEALLLTTIFMHTDESDLMKAECEMVLAKAKEVLGDEN